LWPLYNRLLRYDVVAHRLARSASYPCPITAGTVPPGRLPLLHRVPKRLFPGSSSLPATWSLCLKSTSTSRFLESSGPLYLVHGLTYATVACRLALVCKLPLIPITRLAPPLSGESVPPGCRPPTPGSHTFSQVLTEFPRSPAFHPVDFNLAVPEARHEPFRCFFLTQAVEIRLLARSASYPCSFSGLEQCLRAATYPAPGSYAFDTGVSGFPRNRIRILTKFLPLAVPAAL